MSRHGPLTPTLPHLLYAATRPSLLILASYLLGIALLARWTLRRSIIPPARLGARLGKEQRDSSPPKLWIVLLALSFASTWFFMFRYFFWSYSNYLSLARLTGVLVPRVPTCGPDVSALPCLVSQTIARLNRVAQWLDNTSLFEEAWLLVTSEALPWWWSVEICTITVGSWALFVRTEGNRLGIPHLWAYMLLGQAVAISAAANLFNLALSLRPAPTGSLMIAHSNRQASDPFGAEQLLQAVEMQRREQVGGDETSPGREHLPPLERTPSQKAMPPPPLPANPPATRTSRSVYTASVLPLPSQLPSLLSRATLALLIVSGVTTVFRIPTSLVSILVMHSFPLILTTRCPVPHAMGERTAPKGLGKQVRELLAPSRVHFVLGLAGLALKIQTTLAAWDAIHLYAIGAIQHGAARKALPHTGGHDLAVAPTPFSLLVALGRSFISNPARSSISSDAVCIGLTTLCFIICDARRIRASLAVSSPLDHRHLDGLVSLSKGLALLTPFLGPSAVFSFYLARREGLIEEAERRDEEVLLRQAGLEEETSPQVVVRERRTSTTLKTQHGPGVGIEVEASSTGEEDEGTSARRKGGRRSLGEDLGIVAPVEGEAQVEAEQSSSPKSPRRQRASSSSSTGSATGSASGGRKSRRAKKETELSASPEVGEEEQLESTGEGETEGSEQSTPRGTRGRGRGRRGAAAGATSTRGRRGRGKAQ